MNSKSSTRKPNIAMCAAFVLFCLTLFSMHFTSGLYARYVARDSAEDSARVAKFDVLVTPKDKALGEIVLATIEQGDDDMRSYVITIDNNSEVAVNYELSLVYVSGVNSEGITHSFLRGSDDAQTGSLAPDSAIDDIVLSFSVDWDNFTKNVENSSEKEETLNFRVIVKITQVD